MIIYHPFWDRIHPIHFLSPIAFASEPELGFDTSVERVVESDRFEHNVRCAEVWYRIFETLSDRKASYLLGCASRVWKPHLLAIS